MFIVNLEGWNVGINNGTMGFKNGKNPFHFDSIPLNPIFQYSNWGEALKFLKEKGKIR